MAPLIVADERGLHASDLPSVAGPVALGSGSPRSDAAAIAQIEYARYLGCDHLAIEPVAAWWSVRFAEARSHIDRWYEASSTDTGRALYRLRVPGPWAAIADLLQTDGAADVPPSVLVLGSLPMVDSVLPNCRVFTHQGEDMPLPYLERTVDVVVTDTHDPQVIAEAQRVASRGVVVVTGGQPELLPHAGADQLDPGSSPAVAIVGSQVPSSRWVSLLLQQLPNPDTRLLTSDATASIIRSLSGQGHAVEVVEIGTETGVAAVDRVLASTSAEELIIVSSDAFPVPGAIRALGVVLAASPDAAVVSATIATPRIADAAQGGFVSWQAVPEQPADAVRRVVPEASLSLAAIRRDRYEEAANGIQRSGATWIQTDEAVGLRLVAS